METVGDIIESLPPAAGHNNPSAIEILRDELELEGEALLRRTEELLGKLPLMPEAVNDDEMAGRFGDMVKIVAATMKAAEAGRVAKKEPFLESGRMVDGFYKKRISDPLIAMKSSIEQRLGIYLRAKAAREKAIREQAERAAREAAQRAAEEARKAEIAMRNAADLEAAIAAQARADDAATAAATAAKAAAEKPAAMARTRGDVGSLGTLRQHWTFKDLDREKIALDVLRPYLSEEDIGKAIRLAIKAGLRQIRGAEIYEAQEVTVR